MRTGRFVARVEGLERREVLSSVHPALLAGSPTLVHGHGTGAQISQVAIPNGSFETVSTLCTFRNFH